jgi:hypothetical protein
VTGVWFFFRQIRFVRLGWLLIIQFNFDHLFVFFVYIENWGTRLNSLINGMSSFTSLIYCLSLSFIAA